MAKTIFVLTDAVTFEAATKNGGYLEHLVETKHAAKYRVKGELPSMSRPMYETLMTGLPVHVHGITANSVVRRSGFANVFSLCREKGLATAAAAYGFFREMYVDGQPFDVYTGRSIADKTTDINYGLFYNEDSYPDSHLFADAETLRRTYQPDFLVIHPMGADYAGHQEGHDSRAYQEAVMHMFDILAVLVPLWRSDGYDIVICSDHGMDALGIHGGNCAMHREVPLYVISDRVQGGDFSDKTPALNTLQIAPLLCALLDVPPSKDMTGCDLVRAGR